jgi:hypothetical protein
MMAVGDIDKVIAATIPIYTQKKPNPKSGKPDCNITVMEKNNFRLIMKSKLTAAKTEQEGQKVIDHYKELFSETGS